MMYQSEIFESDFLKYFNEDYSMNESDFQKAVLYLINKTFSTISVKKRKVIELKKLRSNLTQEEKEAINNIKKDIENGNNLKKYMSKQKEKIDFLDKLKNLYKIDHFHLGKDNGGKFVKRSSKLLFLYFEPKDEVVYMICVVSHPIKEKWGSIYPICFLYEEYPELFEKQVLKGCTEISPVISSDNEYQELYKLGLNSPVEVKKGVYVFPFGMAVNNMDFNNGISVGIGLYEMNKWSKFYRKITLFFGKEKKEIYQKFKFHFNYLEGILTIEAFYSFAHRKEKEIYFWSFKNNCLLNEKRDFVLINNEI